MATLEDSPSPSPYDTAILPSAASADLPSFIDPSLLPSGLPLLGPLSGYTTSRRNKIINSRLTFWAQHISRPLDPAETVALAEHTAKRVAITSYGPTLGVLAAGHRTYATRHNYRWPCGGPMLSTPEKRRWGGIWDGERLWLKREIGAAWGVQTRRTVMHLVRGSAYAFMGFWLGEFVVAVNGLAVTAYHEARDERLEGAIRAMKEVTMERAKEIKSRRRELGKGVGRPATGQERQEVEVEEEQAELVGLGGRKVGFEQQREQVPGGGDRAYGQGEREAGDLWGRHRERIQRGGGGGLEDIDDASPTGGMGMLDFGEEDTTKVESQEADETSRRGGKQPNRRARRRMDGQHVRNRDAPNVVGQDSGSTIDDGLSAWERIRRGADSAGVVDTGSTPSPSPMSTDGRRQRRSITNQQRSGDDDFAFSSSDQERSYAQSEAQNEFDKRVEQERRGGDFNESGQSGWSRRPG